MKNLQKTLLMATAVTFMASGAYADNYRHDTRNTQNYNRTQMKDQRSMNDQRTMNERRTMNDRRNMNNRSMTNNVQYDDQLSSADVMDVQESLNDEGYNIAVDGVWGPNTTRAIRSFQQQNDDLRATGDLDSQTLAELDVEVDNSRDRW